HIALWDVLESCDIRGASDASIANPHPNDLSRVLEKAPVRRVFCTGAAAGRYYAKLCEAASGLAAEVLPSPSPANAAWSLPRLVEAYRPVADATTPFKPPVLEVSQVVALERAIAEAGTPLDALMRRAGRVLAFEACKALEGMEGAKEIVILCGSGNNGGDGFVVARKLAEESFAVTAVLLCGQPKSAQAREMYSRMEGLGVSVLNLETEPYMAASAVREAQLVVDAVYGIGFHGDLPDYMRPLFRQVNAAEAITIAIDVPSGMDCDTGLCDPDTLAADRTITFTAMKPGLLSAKSSAVCGAVEVVGIGIDERLIDQFTSDQSIIDWDMVVHCFQPRPADSHKGTYGHLLSVCGSYGMAGAAILAARAALRCGAGLVTAAMPASVYPLAAGSVPEALFLPLPETGDGFVVARKLAEESFAVTAVLL
ncbi:NAD(P)H-hydrate epimerase, partial [Gordonibacter pamelaeae]|uniref:NAD(P)H-hydrate epimerase n=1 Tax=Gordonibacter pamelaeae TaxID=471189 RepID=UPI00242D2315